MTIVCRSYVIGHKLINPTNECGEQYPPDISPIYMVSSNCPDDSIKVKQLYIDLMILVISLLTLLMSVGFNIPLILTQYVIRWVGLVSRFLTIYNTCMFL